MLADHRAHAMSEDGKFPYSAPDIAVLVADDPAFAGGGETVNAVNRVIQWKGAAKYIQEGDKYRRKVLTKEGKALAATLRPKTNTIVLHRNGYNPADDYVQAERERLMEIEDQDREEDRELLFKT